MVTLLKRDKETISGRSNCGCNQQSSRKRFAYCEGKPSIVGNVSREQWLIYKTDGALYFEFRCIYVTDLRLKDEDLHNQENLVELYKGTVTRRIIYL